MSFFQELGEFSNMEVDLINISRSLYSRTKTLCGDISSIDMFRIDYKLENATSKLIDHLKGIKKCSVHEELRHLIKASALLISISDYLLLIKNCDNSDQINELLSDIRTMRSELSRVHPDLMIF